MENKLMIKTYVVNMLKDTEKRHSISEALSRQQGLDIQFIAATEGRKMTNEEINQIADYPLFKKRYGTSATLPALGCSISHKRIYEDMIRTQTHTALILEDDAQLSQDMHNALCQIIDEVLDTDIPTAVLLAPDFRYNKNKPVTTTSTGHTIYDVIMGYMTSGYMINLSGAELLYKLQSPVSYMADAWNQFNQKGIRVCGVIPHITSYLIQLGEIGQSQLSARTKNESQLLKLRHFLGRRKGDFINFIQYLQGYRYSKRLW